MNDRQQLGSGEGNLVVGLAIAGFFALTFGLLIRNVATSLQKREGQ